MSNSDINIMVKLLVELNNKVNDINDKIVIIENKIDKLGLSNTQVMVNFSDIDYEDNDESLLKYLDNNSIISDIILLKELYFNNTNIKYNTIKLVGNNILYWENEWINNENEILSKLIKKLLMLYARVNIFDNYKNMSGMIKNQEYISKMQKKMYQTMFKRKIKDELRKLLI